MTGYSKSQIRRLAHDPIAATDTMLRMQGEIETLKAAILEIQGLARRNTNAHKLASIIEITQRFFPPLQR